MIDIFYDNKLRNKQKNLEPSKMANNKISKWMMVYPYCEILCNHYKPYQRRSFSDLRNCSWYKWKEQDIKLYLVKKKIVLGIILSLFLKIDHMHIEKTENKYIIMATNYFCLVSNRHFLFSHISKFYMMTHIRVANCCYKYTHTHTYTQTYAHTWSGEKRKKQN